MTRGPCAVLMLVAGVVAWAAVCPAQVLETESARLRRKGSVQLGANLEYQASSEGHEFAIPFVFEYGITDRLGAGRRARGRHADPA